jgi:hypothetical protein
MARALVRSVCTFVKPANPTRKTWQRKRRKQRRLPRRPRKLKEDQEDEEVSARFSASQSCRSIATTIAGEPDASQDVSGRKRGDNQTGFMCTRLKKPTTDAHGSKSAQSMALAIE